MISTLNRPAASPALSDARGQRTSDPAGGASSRVRLTPRGRLVLVAVATVSGS